MRAMLLALAVVLGGVVLLATVNVAVLYMLGFGPFYVAFLSFMNGVGLGSYMPRVVPAVHRQAVVYLRARQVPPEGGA